MRRLDDPALVAEEYADETRLRRRASAYTGEASSEDARVPAVAAVVEAAPDRVLEVGCGWGELAEWIARETRAEVVATDLSPRMVELARERGVDAHIADVQDLPFADGEFDVAVTNSRFHLMELRELAGSGPSTLSFARETGEALLAPHFARIRRIDIDGTLEFADRAEVEEYVLASISMSPFVGNLPATVDEPVVARRANSIFVAETA